MLLCSECNCCACKLAELVDNLYSDKCHIPLVGLLEHACCLESIVYTVGTSSYPVLTKLALAKAVKLAGEAILPGYLATMCMQPH
jgi:hypothetical protein